MNLQKLVENRRLSRYFKYTDICIFTKPMIEWLEEYKNTIKVQNQDIETNEKY